MKKVTLNVTFLFQKTVFNTDNNHKCVLSIRSSY